MILQSTITCPNCGSVKTETMPTDACQFFYNCPTCRARLKPNAGDCCVFCSYGDVPCPPVQEAREKNEPCYCEGAVRIANNAKNFEWPNLLAYAEISQRRPTEAEVPRLTFGFSLSLGGNL